MCAGRATHQPTSNGEENIACCNKSLIRGVEREHLSLSNSVLHTGEMKAADLRPSSHMLNLFLAVFPEIFIINATFILLIHGVVFSTSKKYDYPPLVSNVGWLGLLSVLITLLLLAAGAPLLTIAHLFWNHFLGGTILHISAKSFYY